MNEILGKIRQIIYHPHKILRNKSTAVKTIKSTEVQTLIDDMIITMTAANGIGLAAPQVGQNMNLFVMNDGSGEKVFINPIIIYRSRTKNLMEEGCLSIPEVFGLVERPAAVWVIYRDRQGKLQFSHSNGLTARIIQHEFDHLRGILFIDKCKKITQGKDILEQYEINAKS